VLSGGIRRFGIDRHNRVVDRIEVDVAGGLLAGFRPASDRRGKFRESFDVLVDADGVPESLANVELLLEEAGEVASLRGQLREHLHVLFHGNRPAALPAAAEIDEQSSEERRPTERRVGVRQIAGDASEVPRRPFRFEVGNPRLENPSVGVRNARKAIQQLIENLRSVFHPEGSRLGRGSLRILQRIGAF
jgi:hypothetical protein